MPKKSLSTGLREVSASGSHYQIGVTVGKQCRDMALRMEKRFRASVASAPGMDMKKAVAYARKSLPASRKYAPGFVEELEGYAEGTGIGFDIIYAMTTDLLDGGKGKACTDIAVNSEWTKDDCVFAAHNEDVCPYSYADIAIARIKPSDEPGYIGMNYGGIWPTEGMNAAGISLTGNAVVPNDVRMGIPKEMPVRMVLAQEGLYHALRASMPEGRGHSFNNIICDSNGEIYSMEGSATTFDALYAEQGWLVHTNHYLSPKMWKFEADMHTRYSSILRYNRATRLFRKELGKVDLSTFRRILSDHVGYPESICRHPDPELTEEEQTMSIFSVVFNLTDKVAHVCYGNPCQGEYKRYEL
jgi:isopenicillin-N N-acyltransferase-like protein